MIICKSKAELEIMREAGRIVAFTHPTISKIDSTGDYNHGI